MRRTFRSKESGSKCNRAVDWEGNTLDFLLTAKRDATAAQRFFRKALAATHTQTPRVINVDKNAAYPKAEETLKAEDLLPETTELRQNKYLNNIVEQDHRFIKRLTLAGMGFRSFNTARRTLRGYEAMNMIRKGQVQGVAKGNIRAQVEYARSNLPSCCVSVSWLIGLLCP